MKVLLIELKERQPIKFWLYISIRVIKVIEKEWFQHQNKYLRQNSEVPKQLC